MSVLSVARAWNGQHLRDRILLALICLVPVLVYLPFAGVPFERDEGVYATIAQGLLNGEVPYRDLFDNKPPLVYGWYAFSFLLFGENVVAPRLIAAALLSLTTLAVFAQARMLFLRREAFIASGVFATATGLPFVALHANTEAYMLLPLVASLVAFTLGARSGRLGWFVVAGTLGALAMMTKQVAVWNLLALGGMAIIWRWRVGGRLADRFAPAAALLSGSVGACAMIATPFLAAGALDDLVYANVSYNWLYVGFLTLGDRVLNLVQGGAFVFALSGPLLAAAVIGFWTLVRRKQAPLRYVVAVWALASLVGVVTGGRFFPHYFLHLVPALAIMAGLAISDRLRTAGLLPRPAMVGLAILLAVSLATNAFFYAAPWRTEERVAPTVFTQKQWEESSVLLGAYIADRTAPDDTIFNLGRESQIYFYAQRRPATTYFYDWAYKYDERTLQPTIEALELAPPAYIVDSLQPPLFERTQRPAAFTEFIEKYYEYEGRVYFADVYRLDTEDPRTR